MPLQSTLVPGRAESLSSAAVEWRTVGRSVPRLFRLSGWIQPIPAAQYTRPRENRSGRLFAKRVGRESDDR